MAAIVTKARTRRRADENAIFQIPSIKPIDTRAFVTKRILENRIEYETVA
jgi:hypothetical protein